MRQLWVREISVWSEQWVLRCWNNGVLDQWVFVRLLCGQSNEVSEQWAVPCPKFTTRVPTDMFYLSIHIAMVTY